MGRSMFRMWGMELSLVEVSIAPAVTHRAQPKMGGGYAGQAAAITTLK